MIIKKQIFFYRGQTVYLKTEYPGGKFISCTNFVGCPVGRTSAPAHAKIQYMVITKTGQALNFIKTLEEAKRIDKLFKK